MTSEPALTTAGDDDRWMLVTRFSGDNWPLVVRTRCNPEVAEFARNNVLVAIVCDVDADFVREDGMPSCFDELVSLEDALIAAIASASGHAYHTASVTGNGQRGMYFAIPATLDLESIVGSASTSVGVLSFRQETDYESYDVLTTPTELEHQLDGDRSVVDVLESKGDDGTAPRKVNYWLYGERAMLEALITRVAPMGFDLSHWLDGNSGIVVTRRSAANMEMFVELTPVLLNTAAEFGVTYDGWETEVVLPQAARSTRAAAKSGWLSKLFHK